MYCSNKNLKESIWFLRIFFLKNRICVLKIILDLLLNNSWTSLVAQTVKHLPAMWETWVQPLGREDPLEKEMATHSITLAWRIPWMEEPARLQSTGWQRVRHDWATSLSLSFSSLSVLNTMSITAQRGEKEIGQPETGKSCICFGHLPKATWILGLKSRQHSPDYKQPQGPPPVYDRSLERRRKEMGTSHFSKFFITAHVGFLHCLNTHSLSPDCTYVKILTNNSWVCGMLVVSYVFSPIAAWYTQDIRNGQVYFNSGGGLTNSWEKKGS